jgi:AcrR family transcriptional regulator
VPRAGLTPDVVVAEAAAVADESGYERLTLAAVAGRLGVALPSLYKHVRGLDGLQAGLATLAVRELGDVLTRAAVGRSGRDALVAVATAYRSYVLAHPGRYAATVRAARPEDVDHVAASDDVLRTVLAVLRSYGLEDDEVVDAARTLRSALHGFAALEAAGGFGLPRDVDRSFDRMVAALDVALCSWPSTPPDR